MSLIYTKYNCSASQEGAYHIQIIFVADKTKTQTKTEPKLQYNSQKTRILEILNERHCECVIGNRYGFY